MPKTPQDGKLTAKSGKTMDIRKFFGATGSSKKVLSGGKAAKKDHDSNEYTDKNTKGASINTEKKV